MQSDPETITNFREQKTDLGLLKRGMAQLPRALREMGFEKMREGQDRGIISILGGQDTICVFPTSLGKTAVFIIPTLCHNWKLLVFSPLKALMRDQVQGLQNKGITALQISSDQKEIENQRAIGDWVRGECKILYVAPERLNNEAFMRAMRQVPPDAVAVDECFPGRFKVLTDQGAVSLSQLADDYDSGCSLPLALTAREDGSGTCYRRILRVMRRAPRRGTSRIKLSPEGFVECTPDHIWFTKRGEVTAEKLLVGDLVCAARPGAEGVDSWAEVVSNGHCTYLGQPGPELFDLEIECYHRFYVVPESDFDGQVGPPPEEYGVLVHNCHVLSAWSDNFRHSYCKIGDFVEQFNPRVLMAFTATMPEKIEHDVRRVLRMPGAVKVFHFPIRHNLKLSSSDLDLHDDLNDRVAGIDGRVLVYCGSKELTVQTAQRLAKHLGDEVGFYHSEIKESTKKMYQDAFQAGSLRVMCATNAFGMGVDVSSIRGVIHLRHPGDPESLAQEVGRAGRDGLDSICHAYSSKAAVRMQEGFIDRGHPAQEYYERVFRFISRSSDAAGNYHLSYQEIEDGSKVGIGYLTSIFEALLGHGVIESLRDEPKVSKVRFLRESELGRFIQLQHELDQIAARDGEWLLFDMDRLAAGMAVGQPTVAKYLNTWKAEGLLEYDPPPRGAAKKIIGDLSLLDFDRLKEKRQLAYKKLDYVRGYFDVPDEEKHEYLQRYFLKR